jgi:hypothetical protein
MEEFFIEDIKENLQGPINEKLVGRSKLANQIVTSGGNIVDALSAMRQKNLGGDLETNEIESRQHTPSMIETFIIIGQELRNLYNAYSHINDQK